MAIEIDLVATEELLVAAELLSEHDRDDRGKVELAVGRLIDLLVIAAEQGH